MKVPRECEAVFLKPSFRIRFGCCLCRLLTKYKKTNTTTTTTKTMIEIHSLAPKMRGIYIKEMHRDSRIISFVPSASELRVYFNN